MAWTMSPWLTSLHYAFQVDHFYRDNCCHRGNIVCSYANTETWGEGMDLASGLGTRLEWEGGYRIVCAKSVVDFR